LTPGRKRGVVERWRRRKHLRDRKLAERVFGRARHEARPEARRAA
jgi:hypothetical protein